MNEMGWVEYVNYTKKKAEVEALETTGENVSSGDSPAPSSCLPNPRGVPRRAVCPRARQRFTGALVRACQLSVFTAPPPALQPPAVSLPDLPFWLLTQQSCSALLTRSDLLDSLLSGAIVLYCLWWSIV